MNLGEILKNILEISDYPKNKREAFIDSFFEYYFFRLINQVGAFDTSAARQLTSALDQLKDNPQKAISIWERVNENPNVSEIVEKVTGEVLGELADDVAKWATDEQKQQILAVLPQA